MQQVLWEKRICRRERSFASRRLVALLLGAGLLLTAAPVPAAKFTAALERDTINLGESATLSLTFEGGSPKALPEIPPIAGLSYGGSFSHSVNQSIDFGNNSIVSRDSYLLSLTPQKAGEFIIPSLTADVAGQKLTTQPVRLTVLKPAAPTPEAVNSGSQVAFLKLQLPKKELYLGEVVTAELQFYFRQGVQLAGSPQITSTPTEGLTVGKIAGTQPRQARIGNTVYSVIPASVVLTAVKTGPLTIGPITASVVIQQPSANRRRNSLFEQFGMEDPFNPAERKQLSIATDTQTLQSLPLPTENVPPDFNGAVGSYTMNVTAGPTNVATGDPITVRVQIAGRGALDALTLPTQSAWRDFKAYPPTANIEASDQLGVQGAKTFEQIITPQSTDIHELPAFAFSFFDPDAKAYRTLTQPSVPLNVRPGGAAVAPTIAATKASGTDVPAPAQDIVHIKPRLGALAQIGPPLVQQPWFIALQTTPVVAFLAALGWRKRADALANNPRLRRQRQVAKIMYDGLNDLRRLAAENNSEEFFATLFRLLQEQLGERLDCPASAITEAVIDEKLRPRGGPDATFAALHELFQACNLARYAPVQSSQELAAMVPRLEEVLGDIRQIKP